jgi:hypothetical protein
MRVEFYSEGDRLYLHAVSKAINIQDVLDEVKNVNLNLPRASSRNECPSKPIIFEDTVCFQNGKFSENPGLFKSRIVGILNEKDKWSRIARVGWTRWVLDQPIVS